MSADDGKHVTLRLADPIELPVARHEVGDGRESAPYLLSSCKPAFGDNFLGMFWTGRVFVAVVKGPKGVDRRKRERTRSTVGVARFGGKNPD